MISTPIYQKSLQEVNLILSPLDKTDWVPLYSNTSDSWVTIESLTASLWQLFKTDTNQVIPVPYSVVIKFGYGINSDRTNSPSSSWPSDAGYLVHTFGSAIVSDENHTGQKMASILEILKCPFSSYTSDKKLKRVLEIPANTTLYVACNGKTSEDISWPEIDIYNGIHLDAVKMRVGLENSARVELNAAMFYRTDDPPVQHPQGHREGITFLARFDGSDPNKINSPVIETKTEIGDPWIRPTLPENFTVAVPSDWRDMRVGSSWHTDSNGKAYQKVAGVDLPLNIPFYVSRPPSYISAKFELTGAYDSYLGSYFSLFRFKLTTLLLDENGLLVDNSNVIIDANLEVIDTIDPLGSFHIICKDDNGVGPWYIADIPRSTIAPVVGHTYNFLQKNLPGLMELWLQDITAGGESTLVYTRDFPNNTYPGFLTDWNDRVFKVDFFGVVSELFEGYYSNIKEPLSPDLNHPYLLSTPVKYLAIETGNYYLPSCRHNMIPITDDDIFTITSHTPQYDVDGCLTNSGANGIIEIDVDLLHAGDIAGILICCKNPEVLTAQENSWIEAYDTTNDPITSLPAPVTTRQSLMTDAVSVDNVIMVSTELGNGQIGKMKIRYPGLVSPLIRGFDFIPRVYNTLTQHDPYHTLAPAPILP
jgi:hypothetical protein